MNYWVIKGRPSENDFEKWLRPNGRERWRTASPPKRWAAGDRLVFWKAAPELCVIGLGELTAPGRRQPRGVETWFTVRYLSPSLTHPLGIEALRRDRIIRGASFLKSGPAGTVFPLSAEQGARLFGLVQRLNPFVGDVWPELGEQKPGVNDIDLLEKAPEGAQRLVEHMRRERDRRLVEAKRRAALQAGSLACEVCGFDFESTYGAIGRGFCEVHHREALAKTGATVTSLRDLAIVCSNCHRMLHRRGAVGSLAALKRSVGAKT